MKIRYLQILYSSTRNGQPKFRETTKQDTER